MLSYLTCSSESDPMYRATLVWSAEPWSSSPVIYSFAGCAEKDERLFDYLQEKLNPKTTTVDTLSIINIVQKY